VRSVAGRRRLGAPLLLGLLVGLLAWARGEPEAWGEPPAPQAPPQAVPQAALLAERIQVFDEAGAPLESALLARSSRRLGAVPLLGANAESLSQSGEGGWLTLPAPARDPGAEPPFVVLAPGHAPRLLSALSAQGRLVLPQAFEQRGRVRWSGGLPAAGASLVLMPVSAREAVGLELTSDAQGRYLTDRLATGAWRLVLERKDGRRIVLRGFDSGQSVEEAIAPLGGALSGRLVDAHLPRSQGARAVALRLLPLPRSQRMAAVHPEARSDADGRFLLPDLAPGVYELELRDPEWRFDQAVARVEVPEGGVVRELSWFVARRPSAVGQVLTGQGAPLVGARVRLLYEAGQVVHPAQPLLTPPGVETDAQGRFSVPRLDPTPGMRLLAEAPGFAPLLSAPFEIGERGVSDLGAFRLSTGWTLELEVRDVDHKTRAGVAVVVTAAAHPAAGRLPELAAFVRQGVTGTNGVLSLANLPPEDAWVTLGLPGHVPLAQRIQHPLSSSMRRERVILARAPSLSGRISTALGTPAVGLTLTVRPRGTERSEERSTRSDALGAFLLPDLVPQPHDLEVFNAAGLPLLRLEGVVPEAETLELVLPTLLAIGGSVEGLREQGPEATALLEAPLVDERGERRWRVIARSVLPKGLAQAWFRFEGLAPGEYTARVVQGVLDSDAAPVRLEDRDVDLPALRLFEPGSVAGSVLDPDGRPILGARVALVRLRADGDAPPLPGGPLLTASDERGAYLFPQVAAGLWRLEAEDVGRGADVEVLRMDEGETLLARDLVLDAGGGIEGVVRDAQGLRLDGVRLRARRIEADVEAAETRTRSDGSYAFRGLVPGAWRVEVADGPRESTRREALITVLAGELARLDFEPAPRGELVGTVTRRGERVAGARLRVEWLPEDGAALERVARAVTDSFGGYAVEGLEAGRYRIVLDDGTASTGGEVALADGDRLTVDLELWEGRVAGEVVDLSGRPVPYAEIQASPSVAVVGELKASARAGVNGRFVLTGLPVGRYDLRVRGPGRAEAVRQGVQAELPGVDRPISIVLGRGGEIDVEVRGPDGRPVGGARLLVVLSDEEGAPSVEAVSGPSGRVRLQGVPPGEVRVSVYARDLGRASAKLSVGDGELRRLDLRIERAGTLFLRVESEGSDPTPRTRIDVVAVGTGEVIARRRPLLPSRWGAFFGIEPRTGQITLRDLAAGDYEVQVNAGPRYAPAKALVRVRAAEATRAVVKLAPAK